MTALSTAREFWDQVVRLDYQDFARAMTDLRCATHAALSLFHLHDWLYVQFESDKSRMFDCSSKERLVEHLLSYEHADFGLIKDVANAHKHFKLDRGQPKIARASQVSVRGTGWGEGRFGEGPWGGTPTVVVDLGNGQIRHFSAVARNVYEMWGRLFQAHGW